ncbi:tRNA pseudouridine(55) synthase TruB [Holzapfeliella sp. He02]|uniref:tRNA pseudouridine synthase B n=1 Tax=Holzapfeliella saturejae TaxID=3082953 RepID=A0ABU8SGL2_9LACO
MLSGVIVLYKTKGMTSTDCVRDMRRVLQMKKVGHGGTLDPSVEGILPIAIGQATKIIDLMQTHDKTYIGEAILGFETDTEDLDGEIIKTQDVEEPFSEEAIEEAMSKLTGEVEQLPPMYSSVKVKGRRLYDYARNNIPVERPVRHIHVSKYVKIGQSTYDEANKQQRFKFEITCSKGTYVRTLIKQLGDILGGPAVMSSLTRAKSAGFGLKDAVLLETLKENPEKAVDYVVPLERFFEEQPAYQLSDKEFEMVQNGAKLKFPIDVERLCLYHNRKIKAIYKKDVKHPPLYRPEMMLLQNS